MGLRWYLSKFGRRFHLEAAPGYENIPDDAVPFDTFSHHLDELDLSSIEDRLGTCNRCGMCCGHPEADCPSPTYDCGWSQRMSKQPGWHFCEQLSSPGGGGNLGNPGKGTCLIWQTLPYEGYKACVYWPDYQSDLDEYFWIDGFCTFSFTGG